MELKNLVQDQLQAVIDDGTYEKIIRKQLEKTLENVTSDLLGSWGDFSKEIKEAVKKSLTVNLERLTVLDYTAIVNAVIKQELDKSVNESLIKPISDAIKAYTGDLEKQEWKLSEVLDKFKKQAESYERDGAEKIGLEVDESSYGYKHVYFDYQSKSSKYGHEFQLDLDKEGKIYNFSAGKLKLNENRVPIQPNIGNFEKFLFRLYAQKCTIIVDEADVYYDEDYD